MLITIVFKRFKRLKLTYFNANASVLFIVQMFVYMGNESSYTFYACQKRHF